MLYYFYWICVLTTLYIRPSSTYAHLDDNWYPQDTLQLKKDLQLMRQKARAKYNDSFINPHLTRACIIPHASVHYSGIVATAVYQHLDPSTKRIIILAPDHKGQTTLMNTISTSHYITAAGTTYLDTTAIKKLINTPLCTYNDSVFASEHSLEIQLPFIHHYCPQAKIIPLIIGKLSCNQALSIAQELKKYITQKTIVIVSSDFVHHGASYQFTPFNNHQLLRTRALNSQAIQLIEKKNCNNFEHFITQTDATICGVNPLKILINLLNMNAFGTVESRLVAYDTSSKSDTDNFVSYVGMIFTNQLQSTLPFSALLTAQEKSGLLQQAHDTLQHMFDSDFDETLYYPLLSNGTHAQQGVFTTLYDQDKTLRGCIGKIETDAPLYKTVPTTTRDAALSDSRFNALTADEIPHITMHLSILSSPQKITYQHIVVGKDGVILQLDNKSALFLPEVALEQKWTKEQMLDNLALKAGLDQKAWHSNKSVLKKFNTITIP